MMQYLRRLPGVLARLAAASGLLMLVSAAGCEDGGWNVPRTEVTGTVTYDDQPVQEGLIRFLPTGDTEGPTSAAEIQNGRYTIDAEGGVPVGSHRVEIEAYREDPNASGEDEEIPGVEGPPREQYLPEKYNRQSELTATIEGNGPVTKDFELSK